MTPGRRMRAADSAAARRRLPEGSAGSARARAIDERDGPGPDP